MKHSMSHQEVLRRGQAHPLRDLLGVQGGRWFAGIRQGCAYRRHRRQRQSRRRFGLDETREKSLANAQNAWIKYRDLSCDFETSGAREGSVFQMVLSLCLTEKTRSRIEEIKKQRICEEGDVSCSR
jgi:hypothetical protein